MLDFNRCQILIFAALMFTSMKKKVSVAGCAPITAKLHSLRKEMVFQYDTKKYPFLECAREILEFEAGPLPDLDCVHHSEMGKDQHIDGSGNKLNKLQAIWNSNRCRIDNDFHLDKGEVAPNYERLDDVYHSFVKEVIGPQMGGGTIQYQRAPTLRVYTPSTVAMGKMHNDCDYNHQPSEINFWLPLTSVFGSNTMWVESEENKGDFHPLVLKYGEYCRFYGNKCRHFTIPNDSDKTRISLDFRAVSESSGGHNPLFRKGVRRGVKARFQNVFDVGGFYVECQSERPSIVHSDTFLPESDNQEELALIENSDVQSNNYSTEGSHSVELGEVQEQGQGSSLYLNDFNSLSGVQLKRANDGGTIEFAYI